jgi:hypothetical protein
MKAFTSVGGTLNVAFRLHLIWLAGMLLSTLLVSVLAPGEDEIPEAWVPLYLPVLAIVFLILFPINAVGALAIARIRRRPLAALGAAVLLGGVWFLLGSIWNGSPGAIDDTSVWTGIGGLIYGLAFVALSRSQHPLQDREA